MKSRSGFWDISGVTLTADWKTRIELTRIELTRVPVRIPILSTDILSDTGGDTGASHSQHDHDKQWESVLI